jgi:Flp pilus assembly protein TadG
MSSTRPGGGPVRRRSQDRGDGVAAIEMAFIAPILVFLALGMVDFGLGIYTKMMVGSAVDAGAAYAFRNSASYSSSNAAAFNTAVQTAAQSAVTISTVLSSSALTASASEQYCCAGLSSCSPSAPPTCSTGLTVGTYIQVTTSAQYSTFLPYNLLNTLFSFNIPNPVTFTAVSTVRVQ